MYLVPVSACQRSILLIFCCWLSIGLSAQTPDSTLSKISDLPSRLFDRIEKKTASLNQQLNDQTQKYVRRMIRQEDRLRNRLSKMDSAGAAQLFANTGQRYGALAGRLQQDTGRQNLLIQGVYRPYTDSTQMVMAFMQGKAQSASGQLQSAPTELQGVTSNVTTKLQTVTGKLQGATSELQALQAKLQDANVLQQYMQQRQQMIQQYLSKYAQLPSGISNTFNQYKAQVYYYKQQVDVYKDMLNDPDKLLQTALSVLDKVPAFNNFVKSHSMLSPFIPEGAAPPVTANSGKPGQGLPSRSQVLATLQEQMGGKTGPSAEALAKQKIQSATGPGSGSGSGSGAGSGSSSAMGSMASISALAGSLPGLGGSGSGSIGSGTTGASSGPGFQPNSQKGRPLWGRLEFGVNLQNLPSTNFYPTTTDLGVSLGYKLNDKNRIGIGASYKIGWAGNLQHLQVSSQGASVRSFLDIRIKDSWFASGGLEYNYQQPVYTIHLLRSLDNWQPAGLIGVSKIVSVNSKVLKNAKLQFLWNFLSSYTIPQTQPFIFRVGYSF